MKNTVILTDKKTGGTVTLKCRKNGLNPASLYLVIYDKTTQKRHLEFLGLHLTGDEFQDEMNIQAGKGACTKYVITGEKKDKPACFTSFIEDRLALIDKPQSRKNGFKALKKLQIFLGKEQIKYADIKDKVNKALLHLQLPIILMDKSCRYIRVIRCQFELGKLNSKEKRNNIMHAFSYSSNYLYLKSQS